MRLFFVMALIIMMVVTIMTVVMTVPQMKDSGASLTRVYIALALLLVTSPFMLMGMIELLWGKAKNPDSKAVGMMTLTFGGPFFTTNLMLCLTANPFILLAIFILTWWGSVIYFGGALFQVLTGESVSAQSTQQPVAEVDKSTSSSTRRRHHTKEATNY